MEKAGSRSFAFFKRVLSSYSGVQSAPIEVVCVVAEKARGQSVQAVIETTDAPRNVCLVHIKTVTVDVQGSLQTTYNNHHFNLVVFDKETAYIFEPAKVDVQVQALIKAQFPNHIVKFVDHHPQKTTDDEYCMAYVCMFAQKALAHPDMKMETIKLDQNPRTWNDTMHDKYRDLGTLPLGHDYDHHPGFVGFKGPLGNFGFGVSHDHHY